MKMRMCRVTGVDRKLTKRKASLPTDRWRMRPFAFLLKPFVLWLFIFQVLNPAFHLLYDLLSLLRGTSEQCFGLLILSAQCELFKAGLSAFQ